MTNVNNNTGSQSVPAYLGELSNTPFVVNDRVSNDDPLDRFSFSIFAPTSVRITLTGLAADANLELYEYATAATYVSGHEILIDRSDHPGTAAEEIVADLNYAGGGYAISIQPGLGPLEALASTDYTLIISPVEPIPSVDDRGLPIVRLRYREIDATPGEPNPALPDNAFLLDGRYVLTDGDDYLTSPILGVSFLLAKSGADRVLANGTLLGQQGPDTLFGGAGNDQILGGKASDEIYGKSGDDVLRGDKADDRLFGEAGADTLFGGKGRDDLNGGAGDDFLVASNPAADTLTGGEGNDVVVLAGGEAAVLTVADADIIRYFEPGSDHIGLTDGITFEDLTFTPVLTAELLGDARSSFISYQDSLAIRVGASGPYLGILQGLTQALSANDFVAVEIQPREGFGDVVLI